MSGNEVQWKLQSLRCWYFNIHWSIPRVNNNTMKRVERSIIITQKAAIAIDHAPR